MMVYLNIQQNGVFFPGFFLIIFTVSSFTKSNCRDFIANDEWRQLTRP